MMMSDLKAILDSLDAAFDAQKELTIKIGDAWIPLSELKISECNGLCYVKLRFPAGPLEGFIVSKNNLVLQLSSQLAKLELGPICDVDEEPQEPENFY
jgi:hypothetical protein